jgi:TRAP-type transport system small permease protein
MVSQMKEKKKIPMEHWITALLFGAMAVIAFLNILCRYFFHFSIGATEEITINLFVWITVIGAGMGFERGAQLGMVTFFNLFPLKAKKILVIFGALLSAGLFLLVCFYTLGAIHDEITIFHAKSPSLGLPVWVYYAGVPILSVFVFKGIFRGTMAQLSNLNQGNP